MIYFAIVLLLMLSLSVGVWGVYTFATGFDRQRLIVARSVLNDAERRANGPFAKLDDYLRRTDIGRWTEKRIHGSGVKVRVSVLFLLILGAGVLTIIFVNAFLGPVMAVAAAIGVGFAFFGYLRRRQIRRSEDFIAQLPELARVLSNAASAGLAIRVAIGMAADELAEPAATELRRTADALSFGQSFEDALGDLRDRLPSRELAVLISTLVISSRSGGAIVTALRNISTTLEERKETRRQVKTIMGEAVVTTWAVLFMGLGTMLLLNAMLPGSVRRMTENVIGLILLAAVFALFGLGVLVIRRITRINV